MSSYLKHLSSGDSLSSEQMEELLEAFQAASSIQQSAVLAAISARGVSMEELVGGLQFLQKQALAFPPHEAVIDLAGTGGDGLKTFNISTAASLVVASCGVPVAKHAGRAVSSLTGSMDIIQYLGLPIYDNPTEIIHSLAKHAYAVVSAPLFNPMLHSLTALRKELAIPTLFNILGPMANPLRPQGQVIGVYKKNLLRKVAEVLRSLGGKNILVVHSQEGLDEISVSGKTFIAEVKNGCIHEYSITPEEVGLPSAPLQEVVGGLAEENAQTIRGIFNGSIKGAKLNIVLFNAAAGLLVGRHAPSLMEGIQLAREAISTGRTLHLLQQLQTRRPS